MEYIKIKERKDIFRLGIIDEKGNIVKDEKGDEICLEFDLGDINLPLNYNKCVNMIKQARNKLKTQFIIIDKKQDHKKHNNILSQNEEEKMKVVKQFYREMEEAMDVFLGKGGTRKYLNGRKPYWEMFDDIDEALKPHLKNLKLTATDMTNRIKEKYKVTEKDGLEDV